MQEMARTNLYNLRACLFGGVAAEFKKARYLREKIGISKCLSCFYGKLITGIGIGGKNTHKHSQVAKRQLNKQCESTNTELL